MKIWIKKGLKASLNRVLTSIGYTQQDLLHKTHFQFYGPYDKSSKMFYLTLISCLVLQEHNSEWFRLELQTTQVLYYFSAWKGRVDIFSIVIISYHIVNNAFISKPYQFFNTRLYDSSWLLWLQQDHIKHQISSTDDGFINPFTSPSNALKTNGITIS